MSQTETGNGNKNALPDFLIIGAQKCGTTTLRNNLEQHPGVYMASKEEPPFLELHYFNVEKNWSRGLDWYRSHFPNPKLLQGEKTPAYLSDLGAQKRMHAIVPEARLIVMLRNPVDRAYSAWNHFTQDIDNTSHWGWEVMEFERALERGMRERKSRFAKLFANGMYGFQVNHLLQLYPREQIHVIITERMRLAPEEEYQKVLDFLGLDSCGEAFENQNVRSYSQPMRAKTRMQLERLYQPHNELLFKILGERIPEWGAG